MPARRPPALALAAALGVLAPAVAHAQQPRGMFNPTPEQDRQARAEFLAGREAFARGNFDEAVRRFEHAYQLSGRVQLLYNIGSSYERLHRWPQARDAFNGYLAALPDAPEREEIRGRLAEIEREMERERAREREIERERERAAAAAAEAARRSAAAGSRVIVRTVPAEPGRPLRVAGGIVGGLAVISGITSASVALFTSGHYDRLADGCGSTPEGCDDAVIEDVAQRALFVNVFLGAAVVMGVAAGVMLTIDALRPPAASHQGPAVRAGFAPTPGAPGGLFVLSGAL